MTSMRAMSAWVPVTGIGLRGFGFHFTRSSIGFPGFCDDEWSRNAISHRTLPALACTPGRTSPMAFRTAGKLLAGFLGLLDIQSNTAIYLLRDFLRTCGFITCAFNSLL